MAMDASKNRKWERYGCLLPCQIIPQRQADVAIPSRIINIGRGGVLIEADFNFAPGERVTISATPGCDAEKFRFEQDIHGTVRWGQVDASSLMGLFYVGVEFDELLPLKQAAEQQ